MSHADPAPGAAPTQPFAIKNDIFSGFLVFLIAMPLCLAIAKASGYPPIAGIWTAVIGGILCSFLSDSQLTIKGPAAGLIVIVFGSVLEYTEMQKTDPARVAQAKALVAEEVKLTLEKTPDAKPEEVEEKLQEGVFLKQAYRLSLGIGVVSGLVQVVFGFFRLGKIIDFFPLPAVHGMLASIGIIIISKQVYNVFGIDAPKGAEPLHLLAELPGNLHEAVPPIAFIGLISLAILFFFYFSKIAFLKKVPAQLVVLVFAILAGLYFDLEHEHLYLLPKGVFDSEHPTEYHIGPRFLVDMPYVLSEPSKAFFLPDFGGVFTLVGLKYLVLFSLIGSLESLLSAKAIDLLDPWKRKTNMDRDLMAVGFANTLCATIGGLPMISEIVRSSANINNGAQTRMANRFHGIFLLAFVLLLPGLIHEIPLACLAAMLVFTGYRLASPNEFVKTYQIGVPQLIVFVGTIIATLATDLLMGILTGVLIKIIINAWSGTPLTSTFVAPVTTKTEEDGVRRVEIGKSAVFSNWMGVRSKIMAAGLDKKVVVDLSETRVVDHSVMEKLHELEKDFEAAGGELKVTGLEQHKPVSDHPTATRRKLPLPPGGNPFEKQTSR